MGEVISTRLKPSELEKRFRLEKLPNDTTQGIVVIFLSLLLVITFAILDVLFQEAGLGHFTKIVSRFSLVFFGIIAICIIYQKGSVRAFDLTVSIWFLVLILNNLLVTVFSPADLGFGLLRDVIIIIAIYIAIPLPFRLQIILALFFTAANSTNWIFFKGSSYGGSELVVVFVVYVFSNLFGILISWQLNRSRRHQFLLLQSEQMARKDLENALNELKRTNELLKAESDERQLIMETLHDSEQQLFSMVNCVPGAVYRCRKESEWIFDSISEYIETILGYSTSHFKFKETQSYRTLIHPKDIQKVEKTIKESIEKVEPFEIEYRIFDVNDQMRYIREIGKVSFSSEGEPLWLDGTIFDITDKQFAEDEIKRVNTELERLASTDSLTHIGNRRMFMEYLETEWKRMTREQNELSLILCDIDYFKLFNDNYGHQEGDKCLYRIAQAISSVPTRPADLTARFGGEEFIILLPNTDLKGANHVAEEIIVKINQLKISHAYSSVAGHVTLSLGIASIIPNLETEPESLIKATDEALYDAKNNGRNQVRIKSLT